MSFKFLKNSFYLINLFLERWKGMEKEKKRNINVWLPLTCPPPGTWPATQARALTRNQTCDLLVGSQPGTQSTEPHQPGPFLIF